jgi:hypothetical protein
MFNFGELSESGEPLRDLAINRHCRILGSRSIQHSLGALLSSGVKTRPIPRPQVGGRPSAESAYLRMYPEIGRPHRGKSDLFCAVLAIG